MNCRTVEPLLLAERDGVLTAAQHASIKEHLAACADCRQLRAGLAGAMTAIQSEVASVTVPDIDEEWRTLRTRLHGTTAKREKRIPLAPVLWFGAPLAAAAAVALAFFVNQPSPSTSEVVPLADVASAEFVEAGDADASTMVYVDKESGWLVVWASGNESERSG